MAELEVGPVVTEGLVKKREGIVAKGAHQPGKKCKRHICSEGNSLEHHYCTTRSTPEP